LDYDRLTRFVRTAAERFGRLDALVGNAGTASEGTLALMGAEEIRRTLQTNLESVIHLARQGVREMLRQGTGCVVFISSVAALRGYAGLALYSATKAALDGMTRSLARELGEKNIRVNAVAPGYFQSQMTAGMPDSLRQKIIRRTPLKRLGTAAEVAAAVCFLLSDEARFITGQTLVVDGGLTC
jgi:3-oxoacyl-[acyl-carrier protein] reductase